MLLLAAAAAAAILTSEASPPAPRATATPDVQALATVRIISGSAIRLGQTSGIEGQQLRTTTIVTADGTQRATLVEFE